MGFAGFVVGGWLNHDFGEVRGLCWGCDGSSRRMGDGGCCERELDGWNGFG